MPAGRDADLSAGAREVARLLRAVPDFPREGITFQDLSPVLQDAAALRGCVRELADWARPLEPTHVAAVESRGFLFGTPLAVALGCGFLPIRKPGHLPWRTFAESYELEYGSDTLEIHADAGAPGERVVLVDDLLATGGTAAAAMRLVRRTGAEVLACGFVVELTRLRGRDRLHGVPVFSVLPLLV